MTSVMHFSTMPILGRSVQWPTSRRNAGVCGPLILSRQSLPDDPSGTHTLMLTNVVVGSRIAIRDQANTTTLYDQTAAASTVVIPLQVYAGGSALNNWRIKIRKASSGTTYIPYETIMTATPGASSIYVSQIPDE